MALLLLTKFCRSLPREPVKRVICGAFHPGFVESCAGAKRHLLSEHIIKLRDFQWKKAALAHLLNGPDGNFIELFQKKLQEEKLILTSDLKLLLHLCQSQDDMMVARNAIERYFMQNRNMMQGDFRFGPLFMRLCYELDLEDMAHSALTDDALKGFFLDLTSFNIGIDMLFKKGLCEEALEVMDTMRNQGLSFNNHTVLLRIATFYKMNSAKSHEMSCALIEDERSKGVNISRHIYFFAVALALRQNDLNRARQFFRQIAKTDSRLCQNLKVMMLAMSGDVEGAISVITSAMEKELPDFVRKTDFTQEVVDLLILHSDGKPVLSDVEATVAKLIQAGLVTEHTLDDMLIRGAAGKLNRAEMQTTDGKRVSRRTLQ